MDEEKREKFLKVYYNLPLQIREEVVINMEEKPLSWNVAYIEIQNRTKIGEIILEKLAGLNII